jgi:hypothetical protein
MFRIQVVEQNVIHILYPVNFFANYFSFLDNYTKGMGAPKLFVLYSCISEQFSEVSRGLPKSLVLNNN